MTATKRKYKDIIDITKDDYETKKTKKCDSQQPF